MNPEKGGRVPFQSRSLRDTGHRTVEGHENGARSGRAVKYSKSGGGQTTCSGSGRERKSGMSWACATRPMGGSKCREANAIHVCASALMMSTEKHAGGGWGWPTGGRQRHQAAVECSAVLLRHARRGQGAVCMRMRMRRRARGGRWFMCGRRESLDMNGK